MSPALRPLLGGLLAGLAVLQAAPVNFDADETAFPNPERGFYFSQQLENLNEARVLGLRERKITLIAGKISLARYRETAALPPEFLAALERGFETAQRVGAKVIVRCEYGHRGPGGDYTTYEDPDLGIMKGHISQLAELFARNVDRIAFFEAGFVGPWGEWHTTSAARQPALQREVFFHLLDHTPRERMVLLRYPALKQAIFESALPLPAASAYDGSRLARTGHHNDCLLSSANDVGTYNRSGLTMADEIAYLHADTAFTLFGGETCRLHERSERDAALHELALLHATYLNSGYHPDVLKRWRENGVMTELERRLGARLVLRGLELPARGRAGASLDLRFTIENRGFAALYNPRPVELVLTAADGRKSRFPIDQDPRRWPPGGQVEFTVTVRLPADLPAGEHAWSLRLPDASPRLADDARFAWRLANAGTWDERSGENQLVKSWRVEP